MQKIYSQNLTPRLRVLVSSLVAFVFGLALWPQSAQALPTFAQAYHVDCSVCHTFVPSLNDYGRYVQSTAFGALDPSVMSKALPVVVRYSASYKSSGDLNKTNAQTANLKYTDLGLSVNLVGVLNKYVSYRLEQSLYSNNVGGGNIGHFWVSFNGSLNGAGHFILGKFDAPSPPIFSYWMSSGLKEASIAVGQHSYNLGGERWGAMFNYVPVDYKKQPYKVQVAYVGNSSSFFGATSSAPAAFATSPGSDQAFQGKVAYARPDNPIEVGVYGAIGTYKLGTYGLPVPVQTSYVSPTDNYRAAGFYAERDPIGAFPGLVFNYQTTYDSNIGPGTAAQGITQSASSFAYMFEADESFLKGDVVLGLRPVEFLGSYASGTNGFTGGGCHGGSCGYYNYGETRPHYGNFDLLMRDPKISPYLYLTAEYDVSGTAYVKTYNPFGTPLWSIGLKWATPVARLYQ